LKTCISTVAWNPLENNTVAFSDVRGQIGLLENAVPSAQAAEKKASVFAQYL